MHRNALNFVVTVLLVLMMSFGLASSSLAEQKPRNVEVYFVPMHFVFDGKEYAPPQDQQGFIYEGSTYVPLRFISYSLKKAVKWDGDTYTVTIMEPDKNDLMIIQENNLNTEVRDSRIGKLDTSRLAPQHIDAYFEQVAYVFGQEAKEPPAELPGFIYQDKLYVPMRFYSESVGRQIDWDQETYTVAASSEAYFKAHAEAKQKAQNETADPKPAGDKAPIPEAAPIAAAPVITAPAGGSSPIGGNSGGQRSLASIQGDAEAQILQLKQDAETFLINLAFAYLATTDAAEKQSLKNQGLAALAGYDSRFQSIMNSLKSVLQTNEYNESTITGIISDYEARYRAEKALAEQLYT